MNEYRVSVVTVCYQAESLIEKTIQSVICQDYPHIEYIIIDGGSKDQTVNIIKKYANHIDYWLSEPDNGIYDAMNKGIKYAHGDWVIFLNAGDFYHSNNVFSQFLKRINNDTTIAYGLIRYFTQTKEFDMEYIPIEKMEYLDPIPHPATMVRLSYHKKRLFDPSFRSSGDYDFFYRAYFDDKVKFQFIPLMITNYDNSIGISKDNATLIWNENKRVWLRHASFMLVIKMHMQHFLSIVKQKIKRILHVNYIFI